MLSWFFSTVHQKLTAAYLERATLPVRIRFLTWALLMTGLAAAGIAGAANLLGISRDSELGYRQFILLFTGVVLVFWAVARIVTGSGQAEPSGSGTPLPAKWIHLLGLVSCSGFGAYAILSHGMITLPFSTSRAYNAPYYDLVAQTLHFLGSDVQAFVTGRSFLADRDLYVLAYCLPIIAATVAFLALIIVLARHRESLPVAAPTILFRWAAAFAALSVFAAPVLVPDFWYPLAWGRMVHAGLNPYYVHLGGDFVRGLPLNPIHELMMYGPVVAILGGAVMWLAGDGTLLGALFFKLLLAGAWLGSLRLIWLLLRRQSLWAQCVGIATFGWLPLSVMQSVAEGHNDILMVGLMLLWLHGLQERKAVVSALALAASAATKYVTLPLLALDVLFWWRERGQRLQAYLIRALAGLALLILIFGPFCRSPAFFTPLFARTSWRFFNVREAIGGALVLMRGQWEPWYLPELARLIFPLLALYFLVRYVRRPGTREFQAAALTMMCAMLFGYIGGLWPWYLVWGLSLAALIPGTPLARWVSGMCVGASFVMVVWVMFPSAYPFWIFDIPTVSLYVFAASWLAFAPRGWYPDLHSATERSTP